MTTYRHNFLSYSFACEVFFWSRVFNACTCCNHNHGIANVPIKVTITTLIIPQVIFSPPVSHSLTRLAEKECLLKRRVEWTQEPLHLLQQSLQLTCISTNVDRYVPANNNFIDMMHRFTWDEWRSRWQRRGGGRQRLGILP